MRGNEPSYGSKKQNTKNDRTFSLLFLSPSLGACVFQLCEYSMQGGIERQGYFCLVQFSNICILLSLVEVSTRTIVKTSKSRTLFPG
jgi:cAMP phosphodiesterase